MIITTATPVEIDTVLADLYARRGAALAALDGATRGILRAVGHRPASIRHRATLTDDELQSFRARVASDEHFAYRERHFLQAYDKATQTLQQIETEEKPLRTEYARRPWSRFFLVSGGHIHSSMSCSTCNRNGKATMFSWLPDLSGLTEEEAVAAHGAILCTTCYPSAPARMDRLLRPRGRAKGRHVLPRLRNDGLEGRHSPQRLLLRQRRLLRPLRRLGRHNLAILQHDPQAQAVKRLAVPRSPPAGRPREHQTREDTP